MLKMTPTFFLNSVMAAMFGLILERLLWRVVTSYLTWSASCVSNSSSEYICSSTLSPSLIGFRLNSLNWKNKLRVTDFQFQMPKSIRKVLQHAKITQLRGRWWWLRCLHLRNHVSFKNTDLKAKNRMLRRWIWKIKSCWPLFSIHWFSLFVRLLPLWPFQVCVSWRSVVS